MKKLFLGLTSLFVLISVSCESDKKPISFKYVAGELKVGKYSTDTWKYVVIGRKRNGKWENITDIKPITPDSVISFLYDDPKPTTPTDWTLLGSKKSKEELHNPLEEDWQKEVKPVSNTIKDIVETDLLLTSGEPIPGFVKIEIVDNTDGKKVQLTANSSIIDIKNYAIIIDGDEVIFERESSISNVWTGTAKADVTGKNACIYCRKTDAKYLRTSEITL